LHLDDAARLQGVPDSVCETLRQQAQSRQLDGYVLTLDIPCYLPVMQYASDRELRQELYQAYSTRASDQGPGVGRWDNSAVMVEILAARPEMAHLLGFANYAELSLATKMASEPAQVLEFLQSLAEKCRPVALREFQELQRVAQQIDGLQPLEAWDVPYYSEMLRQQRYDISQQQLRPYLPVPKVIAGMFEVANRLFGVNFERDEAFQSYHADVTFYWVLRDGEIIAGFYLDPYARENKRGGAWMADCRNRYRNADGELQHPIAFLTCNFTAPHGDAAALLTHDEVTTLFHEFGHGLHHMLTRIEIADVSGINGVAWDAVELPSQFMENWCWQKPALDLISGHFETGEPLPEALLDKLLAAKNFQAGMMMMRQLEFALFDFRLHLSDSIDSSLDIQRLLDSVREQFAVIPVPAFNRFQHGFMHIFAGGYGAGYYSYKWAELLSADAFSRFERDGIFDAGTGADFRREILEAGGAREAAESFRAFRGRDPDSDALLRHSGILAAST
jgi:oligopeptidase A